jgi:hypothetical protein
MISADDGLQRVRRRQQHRDRGDGTDPGSTPISVPEHAADERVEEVDRRERDAEAGGEVAEKFHFSSGGTRARSAAARRGLPRTRRPASADSSSPAMIDSFQRNSWLAADAATMSSTVEMATPSRLMRMP